MAALDDYNYLVLSVIAEPLDEARELLVSVLSEKTLTSTFRTSEGELRLEDIYVGAPSKSGRVGKKAVIFSPILLPDKTAFVANIADGWQTLVNCISGKTGNDVISLSLSDDSVEFSRNSLEVLRGGRTVRLIYSMLDGDKWEFFEKGEVQSFENPGYYRKRRKADRLNREIVLEYLSKLGISLADSRFWKSDKMATYVVEAKM